MPGGRTVEHFQPSDLSRRYELIQVLSEEFSIETLCLLLLVSRSAYYRWKRGASYQPTSRQEDNSKLVKAIFSEHKRRYGSRRIVTVRRRGRVAGERP